MSQLSVVKNEKPQVKELTLTQGNLYKTGIGNSKHNTLSGSKARYEKGLELYREGRVSINSAGHGFKVSGYVVDTEKVTCECPDYKEHKEPCKHYYAARVFQKNGCKVVSSTNGKAYEFNEDNEFNKVEKGSNKQTIITRLAVLNTATEILRSHNKPIKLKTVLALAAHLEAWALGN